MGARRPAAARAWRSPTWLVQVCALKLLTQSDMRPSSVANCFFCSFAFMTCIIACYQIFLGARAAPASVMLAVAAHHVSSRVSSPCAAAADFAAGAVSLFVNVPVERFEACFSEIAAFSLAVRGGGGCSSAASAAQPSDCKGHKKGMMQVS